MAAEFLRGYVSADDSSPMGVALRAADKKHPGTKAKAFRDMESFWTDAAIRGTERGATPADALLLATVASHGLSFAECYVRNALCDEADVRLAASLALRAFFRCGKPAKVAVVSSFGRLLAMLMGLCHDNAKTVRDAAASCVATAVSADKVDAALKQFSAEIVDELCRRGDDAAQQAPFKDDDLDPNANRMQCVLRALTRIAGLEDLPEAVQVKLLSVGFASMSSLSFGGDAVPPVGRMTRCLYAVKVTAPLSTEATHRTPRLRAAAVDFLVSLARYPAVPHVELAQRLCAALADRDTSFVTPSVCRALLLFAKSGSSGCVALSRSKVVDIICADIASFVATGGEGYQSTIAPMSASKMESVLTIVYPLLSLLTKHGAAGPPEVTAVATSLLAAVSQLATRAELVSPPPGLRHAKANNNIFVPVLLAAWEVAGLRCCLMQDPDGMRDVEVLIKLSALLTSPMLNTTTHEVALDVLDRVHTRSPALRDALLIMLQRCEPASVISLVLALPSFVTRWRSRPTVSSVPEEDAAAAAGPKLDASPPTSGKSDLPPIASYLAPLVFQQPCTVDNVGSLVDAFLAMRGLGLADPTTTCSSSAPPSTNRYENDISHQIISILCTAPSPSIKPDSAAGSAGSIASSAPPAAVDSMLRWLTVAVGGVQKMLGVVDTLSRQCLAIKAAKRKRNTNPPARAVEGDGVGGLDDDATTEEEEAIDRASEDEQHIASLRSVREERAAREDDARLHHAYVIVERVLEQIACILEGGSSVIVHEEDYLVMVQGFKCVELKLGTNFRHVGLLSKPLMARHRTLVLNAWSCLAVALCPSSSDLRDSVDEGGMSSLVEVEAVDNCEKLLSIIVSAVAAGPRSHVDACNSTSEAMDLLRKLADLFLLRAPCLRGRDIVLVSSSSDDDDDDQSGDDESDGTGGHNKKEEEHNADVDNNDNGEEEGGEAEQEGYENAQHQRLDLPGLVRCVDMWSDIVDALTNAIQEPEAARSTILHDVVVKSLVAATRASGPTSLATRSDDSLVADPIVVLCLAQRMPDMLAVVSLIYAETDVNSDLLAACQRTCLVAELFSAAASAVDQRNSVLRGRVASRAMCDAAQVISGRGRCADRIVSRAAYVLCRVLQAMLPTTLFPAKRLTRTDESAADIRAFYELCDSLAIGEIRVGMQQCVFDDTDSTVWSAVLTRAVSRWLEQATLFDNGRQLEALVVEVLEKEEGSRKQRPGGVSSVARSSVVSLPQYLTAPIVACIETSAHPEVVQSALVLSRICVVTDNDREKSHSVSGGATGASARSSLLLRPATLVSAARVAWLLQLGRSRGLESLALLAALMSSPLCADHHINDVARAIDASVTASHALHHLPSNGRFAQRVPGGEPVALEKLIRLANGATAAGYAMRQRKTFDETSAAVLALALLDVTCELFHRLAQGLNDADLVDGLYALGTIGAFLAQLKQITLRHVCGSESTMAIVAEAVGRAHVWLVAMPAKEYASLRTEDQQALWHVPAATGALCVSVLRFARSAAVAVPSAVATYEDDFFWRALLRPPVRGLPQRGKLPTATDDPSTSRMQDSGPVKEAQLRNLCRAIQSTSTKAKTSLQSYLGCAMVAAASPSLPTLSSVPANLSTTTAAWVVTYLCDVIFSLLFCKPVSRDSRHSFLTASCEDITAFDATEFAAVPSTFDTVGVSQHLARTAIVTFGAMVQCHWMVRHVRQWLDTKIHPVARRTIEAFTAKHITVAMLQTALAELRSVEEGPAVARGPTDSETTAISPSKYGGKVTIHIRSTPPYHVRCTYATDEAALGITIVIPEHYPLRPAFLAADSITTKGRSGVAAEQWRKWTVDITKTLFEGQSGTLWKSLERFCDNATKVFEGAEPCPICYSVISSKSKKLPDMPCSVCTNAKFHSECLLEWWGSSGQSSCPMCRSPWYSRR